MAMMAYVSAKSKCTDRSLLDVLDGLQTNNTFTSLVTPPSPSSKPAPFILDDGNSTTSSSSSSDADA